MRGLVIAVLAGTLLVGLLGGFLIVAAVLWFVFHLFLAVPFLVWGLGFPFIYALSFLREHVTFGWNFTWPTIHISLPKWSVKRPTIPKPAFEKWLWYQWLRAKKHHICPLIEFEELPP